MSAYVVVEIVVNNPEGYEEYKKLAPQPIAAYGVNISHGVEGLKTLKETGSRTE